MLLAAALAGYCCINELQSYAGELVLGYGEELISGENVEEFWEKREPENHAEHLKDITLYNNKGYQNVENRELGRISTAMVIEVSGNMNPVFPNRLRRGSLVSGYDEKGCVLSEKLAEEMFSSHEVEGKSVIFRGQEYVVRGLIDVGGKTMMVQGKKENGYSHLWVSYEEMSASAAEQELGQILPREAEVRSEGDLYVGIGRILFLIPPLLIFLVCMVKLRRWYGGKIKNIWIREICGAIHFFVVILGIYAAVTRGLYITDDYLPPSWADFSFWGKLWSQKAEDVKGIFAGGLEYRDVRMMWLLAGSGICSLAESAGVLWLSGLLFKTKRMIACAQHDVV